MRLFLICIIGLICINSGYSQIKGVVTDENNEPLPYVNIHVKNTSEGTTTNFDGAYLLKLDKGQYSIVFQYVGYNSVEEQINVSDESLELNIQLTPREYQLSTVEINAQAEDPAYAIIRKVQAKRQSYLEKMRNYECDAYVRGFNKIYDAPEKILGQDVGDMEGALDSTRQGVVYLSESVSKLYVDGNKSKEVMYSSKVSGSDRGYSFNSAKEMEFNFYKNQLDLNRKIISPIANGAMAIYDYRLEGTHFEKNGQLVNKIKVIPKNEYGPSFYGHIYINEDLWNIHSLELGVTSKATQLPFIDSLLFKQIFIPVDEDRWMPLSNVIRFKMSALGFKIGGNFACVYSNYLMDNVDPNIFNREVFRVEKEANERSDQYWDSLRPIPLTVEEKVDYRRKDSIRIVRESPEYLDSIDRENNKFRPLSILTGYSYQNSIKKTRWGYDPLSSTAINTVQGLNFDGNISYNKAFDKDRNRVFGANAYLNYGFSDNQLRPRFSIYYRANRKNYLTFRLSGGRQVTQYSRREPISGGLNSIMTYFFRRNYMKVYDRNFISGRIDRELGNIFYGRLEMTYEDRSPLTNQYFGSLGYKDSRVFTSNNPQDPLSDEAAFKPHQALILRAGLRIKIGEKIWNYPDQRFKVGSNWPSLWIFYKKALNVFGGDVDYDLLYSIITKSYNTGTFGNLQLYLSAGKFLNTNDIRFIDYYHFMGNQTHVGNPAYYNRRFLLLPYYSNSTNDAFVEFHLQHHFNGFLLSKVPILKKLEWQLVGGVKLLDTPERGLYTETHLGIDNIGFKIFRLFRVDAVWSRQACGENELCGGNAINRFGVVVGLKLDL